MDAYHLGPVRHAISSNIIIGRAASVSIHAIGDLHVFHVFNQVLCTARGYTPEIVVVNGELVNDNRDAGTVFPIQSIVVPSDAP